MRAGKLGSCRHAGLLCAGSGTRGQAASNAIGNGRGGHRRAHQPNRPTSQGTCICPVFVAPPRYGPRSTKYHVTSSSSVHLGSAHRGRCEQAGRHVWCWNEPSLGTASGTASGTCAGLGPRAWAARHGSAHGRHANARGHRVNARNASKENRLSCAWCQLGGPTRQSSTDIHAKTNNTAAHDMVPCHRSS